MKSFLLAIALLSLVTSSMLSQERKPNVILFFVDDLGWTDLGYAGSDLYETPTIDQLAREGTVFTRAYAACTVCSPSRFAVLTGQYPARGNVTDFIPGHDFRNTPLSIPDWTQQLDHEQVTIAEVLKNQGYQTASLGKWHLTPRDRDYRSGKSFPDFYPGHHGFDENRGGHEQGAPASYFWPYAKGPTLEDRKDNNLFRTLPDRGDRPDEYLTDRIAEEAVALIDEWADRPFFFYVPFYNVHTPLMAKPEDVAYFEKKVRPDATHQNATYAAMVKSVDDAVASVVAKLETEGLREKTLIIFTSDNGGLLGQGTTPVTSNLPARNGKGSVYEGGVRVPAFVNWPGQVAPGTLDEPVISMDWPVTIAAALGADGLRETDGENLLPLLTGKTDTLSREALFWHYPHYHSMGGVPYSAILKNGWKLIEFHDGPRLELYHLAEDVHEDRDLATLESERAAALLSDLNAWRERVSAQMPTVNPSFDPKKPSGIHRSNRKTLSPQAPVRQAD